MIIIVIYAKAELFVETVDKDIFRFIPGGIVSV